MTAAWKSPVRRWCLRTNCSRAATQSGSARGNARSVTLSPSAASTAVPHLAVAACPPPHPHPDLHQQSELPRRPAAHCTRCSLVAAPLSLLLSLVPSGGPLSKSPLSARRPRRPTSPRPHPRPHPRPDPHPHPCPRPRPRPRSEPPRRPRAHSTRCSRIAPWCLAPSPLPPRRQRRRVLSVAISRRRAAEWRNHPPWPTGRRTR